VSFKSGESFRASNIRGRKLFHTLSLSTPAGQYHVECDKHPGIFIQIYFSDFMVETGGLADAASRALESCVGCEHERAYATSRWPNAGEPGGAEL
jgi:hypothetical protein